MTHLKIWMRAATADEQRALAERVGTSRAYLYQLSGGFRQASAELGILIERETARMHRASKGRLPRLYRTDLVAACRACEYAERCLGDQAVASEFSVLEQQEQGEFDYGTAAYAN